jgi:hypothetical protein
MFLLFIKEILNCNIVSFSAEVLWGKLFFRIGAFVEFNLFGICPLQYLCLIDTEVFESLHVACCKIKLSGTL